MNLEDYLKGLLGEDAALQLINAIDDGKTIIISGSSGPTGKSTLCRVLKKAGASVFEQYETHEVHLNAALETRTPRLEDLITV